MVTPIQFGLGTFRDVTGDTSGRLGPALGRSEDQSLVMMNNGAPSNSYMGLKRAVL